jgi:predicted alpha/beta-fold hydrolase
MSATKAAKFADYSVPFGFSDPHVQSVLASNAFRKQLMLRRARRLVASSESVDIFLEDGVHLRGFYAAAPTQSRGLVIFIHGWEGSADSQYVLSAAHVLHAEGYEIFRLNLRDHGGTVHLNEELFHSCRIDEVVAAVRWVTERYAAPRNFLAGFSLGGNFGLRVAVRATTAGIELDRVIAVCPVLSPANTMRALERGAWIYRYHFLSKWRRSLRMKAQVFPNRYQFGDLRRLTTLTATTDYFVTHHTPFPNLAAYLNGYAIIGGALEKLEVPAKIVLARDDPVIPIADSSRLARPRSLEVVMTQHGGHCGFLSGPRLGSWIDTTIVEDLRAHS